MIKILIHAIISEDFLLLTYQLNYIKKLYISIINIYYYYCFPLLIVG